MSLVTGDSCWLHGTFSGMPEIELSALPGLLRSLRTRTGRTQVDVAASAGVPQANLSRWESGKVRPSLESLVAVLNALSLDFHDLQNALDDASGTVTASHRGGVGYYASSTSARIPARLSDPTLSMLTDLDRRVSWLEQTISLGQRHGAGMMPGEPVGAMHRAMATDERDGDIKPERVQPE